MNNTPKIVSKRLDEIMPYERNPRKNDEAVEKVADSIREFGFKVPIVIDKAGVIVTGHTRYKAAKLLGLEEVPTIIADDLSPYQIAAFRLADNKVSEYSEWDMSLLDEELSALNGKIDMGQFGFDIDVDDIEIEEEDIDRELYSEKALIPQYEVKGEEPEINDLFDTSKTDELIQEIENSDLTPVQRAFLIEAAHRHTVFNYGNIAEYYAHQDPTMQRLMEKSALVIIDYDDAIAYGYSTMKKRIEEQREKDVNQE